MSKKRDSISRLSTENLLSVIVDEHGMSRNLSEIDMSKFEELNLHSQADDSKGFEMTNIDRYYTPKVIVGSDMPYLSEKDLKQLDAQCIKLSRILILYTGGTIGMKSKGSGYEPEPNYFAKALRRLPMFNDVRFRSSVDKHISFILRKEMQLPNNLFVMPRSSDNVRVFFNVYEYCPLLDSSDMTMDDYIRIAKDIDRAYHDYDGFIILHGTDTMSYTGSALSFLFENLSKPVILTGSQIPLFEIRSDGRENLLASLIIASHYNIPEVSLFFHEKLFRANRSSKMSSMHFDAFDSPNYPPLAEVGISIEVYEHRLLQKEAKMRPFIVHGNLCADVSVLRMFPSITCDTVKMFLAPPVKGVVLLSYGAGNMPYCRKDLLELFRDAYDRGCIIVNITQCWKGGVKAIYKTGFILKEYGIFPGLDMTLESALNKLSYVLSRDDWSAQTKRASMTQNLRGELTLAHYNATKNVRSLSQEGILLDSNLIIAASLCSHAKEGNVDMIEQIGKRRGNWEAADYDGRTALHVASSENQIEVVKFLLQKNINVNTKDRFGCTPLKSAIMGQSHLNLVIELVNHGAILDMSEKDILKEITEAILHNNEKLFFLYLNAGINIDLRDDKGNTLLHIAAIYGKTHLVTDLLRAGCDRFIKNDNGYTASEEASVRDMTEIVEIINNFEKL